MKTNWMLLKQVDKQLTPFKEAASLPLRENWVRTVRKALGLTTRQLAKRLGVDPSRVIKIEMSEPEGAVTLRTLKEVAEKLECQLIYAFVPKKNLESLVRDRALSLAKAQMKRTVHTMELEAQSVDPTLYEVQLNELVDELLRHSWKYLWDE